MAWPGNKINLFLLALMLCAGVARPDDLGLIIIYPEEGQALVPVDSTFIFGSVIPGASVTVNGTPINVHKNGGWLAFIPVTPGRFIFTVEAAKKERRQTIERAVFLPDLPRYDFSQLAIDSSSLLPSAARWVMSGDEIELGFSSLPYCNAFCIVQPLGDTIMLREIPRSYYGGKTVFEKIDPTSLSGNPIIRGQYRGVYRVPPTEFDSLLFVYYIYGPSANQLYWLREIMPSEEQTVAVLHKLAALTVIVSATAPTSARVIHDNREPVVEFRDSVSNIRSAAGKGYLCLHQPRGIRARLIGKDGRWLKIRLSKQQHGWIIDTCAAILPYYEPVTRSFIRRVRTDDRGDHVSVSVATSARHPFRVIENLAEKTITVLLYNADSDTDWIRYDGADRLIDHIVWFQDEPGVFGLKIFLREADIWGYDAHYAENEFILDIMKAPPGQRHISSFRFVIDPGHESDVGAVGPTGLTEKDANLAIALHLKKALEREGAEVIMTRSDQSPLPLYDRPKIAVKEKADIFISIHNNAVPDGTNPWVNNGTSTIYYHPHSAPLAKAVHQSLARNLGIGDFGWYYGNLAVNRPTQYPAILVESAFMMIPEQEEKLKSKRFQQRIADAIVEGVKDFLRGQAKTDWDEELDVSYGR